MRGKWLINETTVETVVLLSKNFERPKEFIQTGIDAEDYYRIKGSLYAQTAIWLHLRIMNRSGLFCTTESLMKRKVPIQVIICIMRSCFDFDNGRKNNLFSYKFKNRQWIDLLPKK